MPRFLAGVSSEWNRLHSTMSSPRLVLKIEPWSGRRTYRLEWIYAAQDQLRVDSVMFFYGIVSRFQLNEINIRRRQ